MAFSICPTEGDLYRSYVSPFLGGYPRRGLSLLGLTTIDFGSPDYYTGGAFRRSPGPYG